MLFDKLRQIEERSRAIERALTDPAIFSQQAEYARLRKEHADSLEVLAKFDEYRETLKRLVLPKDPNDDKNVFVEIRAGAGGDEAALFAADLMRMYTKYAETQR